MKEVHLICNAHIDTIWQWDWQEGVSAVLSTFQTAVNLSKKYEYIFCHNEVTVYKYVEEYAPELFEQIKELVKKGKWHIMGGWYLQPDCNLPSGESIVRQIQEGKRYFLEKFGVFPTTAINFDPFGHSIGLVQIIKKCGQDSYIFMRPYPQELELPDEHFIWRGLDGSEIKAVRSGPYNTPLGKSASAIKERTQNDKHDLCLVLWGVGNHGGGPSDKDLADIGQLQRSSDERYIHSTPELFFGKMKTTAIFDKSLHISMPGCYTSMQSVKRKHAQLEHELYFAEKILSVAYAKGLLKNYPEEEIHRITEDLLNAEFHDVLPGTSIQCGEDNGLKLLDHGLLETERLKTKAYFALTKEFQPAKNGEYPIIVFNPNPYTWKGNVECEFMLSDQNWSMEQCSSISVLDDQGVPVKFQVIKEESNFSLDWRKRIIFESEIDSLSARRYNVYVQYKEKNQKSSSDCLIYDDGRKWVEIDKNTGLLKKYSIAGIDYIKEGFQLVAFEDNSDPWGMSASQLKRLGTNEQVFKLSENPCGVFEKMKNIQIIEDGDIYLGIEAFFEYMETKACIRYKIYKNNDFIDVDVTLFLGNIDKIIKLKIPVCVKGDFIGQTAFGTEKLFMDARENVAHRFVAIEDNRDALVLMNTGVYGNHFENDAIYMSLVRGATYCTHPIEDRTLFPMGRFTKKIDQGENTYSFRLGVLNKDGLERSTQEFVQKPYGLNVFPIELKKDEVPEFKVFLEDEIISICTIKKADGREGILFRLLNNTERKIETVLHVNDVILQLRFGKYEVKTVLYENKELSELSELII